MAPPKKKKSPRAKKPSRAGVAALVFLLAALVVAVGGYLLYDLKTGQALDTVERITGPLKKAGVRLVVSSEMSADSLLEKLASLEGASVSTTVEMRTYDSIELTVRVAGEKYPVTIGWAPPVKPEEPEGSEEPRPEERGPLLAIVIDDFGRDLKMLKRFLALEAPITPAIMPHRSASEKSAGAALAAGREFIIHLPMEPLGYPAQNPGAGAIMATSDRAEVAEKIAAAIQSVPGAVGVNNHMGSRATGDRRLMGWVMEELKWRDLYFLDSLTSAKSVAGAAASEAGLDRLVRDVFLDNEKKVGSIVRQLELSASKARKNGSAIAIGHLYVETLAALERWYPKARAEGIKVVPLSRLLRRVD